MKSFLISRSLLFDYKTGELAGVYKEERAEVCLYEKLILIKGSFSTKSEGLASKFRRD